LANRIRKANFPLRSDAMFGFRRGLRRTLQTQWRLLRGNSRRTAIRASAASIPSRLSRTFARWRVDSKSPENTTLGSLPTGWRPIGRDRLATVPFVNPTKSLPCSSGTSPVNEEIFR